MPLRHRSSVGTFFGWGPAPAGLHASLEPDVSHEVTVIG
jgi:hypothetical protein